MCCALAFPEFGQLHDLALPSPMVDEVSRSPFAVTAHVSPAADGQGRVGPPCRRSVTAAAAATRARRHRLFHASTDACALSTVQRLGPLPLPLPPLGRSALPGQYGGLFMHRPALLASTAESSGPQALRMESDCASVRHLLHASTTRLLAHAARSAALHDATSSGAKLHVLK